MSKTHPSRAAHRERSESQAIRASAASLQQTKQFDNKRNGDGWMALE
jgi:hypothetical protein